MMEDLRVTLVQSNIGWGNISGNLQHLESLIRNVATDLIVLPEMFTTGFSMETNLAETMSGSAVTWMKEMASKNKCVVAGSLMIKDGTDNYNRFIWMRPDGTFSYYDKRHLFRMANEDQHYTQGKTHTFVELKGWRINLLVCYDLRFPVWSRNTFTGGTADYDILLYVANWPERRKGPWMALLPARAIENLAYVVGVNRVGEDGNHISYSGDSAAYDYKGEKLSKLIPSVEAVETVTLSYKELEKFREAFPAWKDADRFDLLGI